MKNCTDCKHADWDKKANGSLHPSGDGQCLVQWKAPPLPACMRWITQPSPSGGHINRRKELKDHCAYYTRG